MPAAMTMCHNTSMVYLLCCDCARRHRQGVFLPHWGRRNWWPLFTDRHGVVISPNLACRFPLALTRVVQREFNPALLQARLSGAYTSLWPDRWRTAPKLRSDTHGCRVPTRHPYGDKGKAAWLVQRRRLCCLSTARKLDHR